MDNLRAGILTAGETRARGISEAICNERATKPAVNRPSAIVHIILRRPLGARTLDLEGTMQFKQRICGISLSGRRGLRGRSTGFHGGVQFLDRLVAGGDGCLFVPAKLPFRTLQLHLGLPQIHDCPLIHHARPNTTGTAGRRRHAGRRRSSGRWRDSGGWRRASARRRGCRGRRRRLCAQAAQLNGWQSGHRNSHANYCVSFHIHNLHPAFILFLPASTNHNAQK